MGSGIAACRRREGSDFQQTNLIHENGKLTKKQQATKPRKNNNMSNSIKFNLSELNSLTNARAAATEALAHTNGKLANAEEEAEAAAHDDGEKSPEEVLEGIATAQKNLSLITIEANRAAVRADEAEKELRRFLEKNTPEMGNQLLKEIENRKASLREKLSPLVADGDSFVKAALEEFILKCDEVRALKNFHYRMQLQRGHSEWNNLASEFGAALKLLNPDALISPQVA